MVPGTVTIILPDISTYFLKLINDMFQFDLCMQHALTYQVLVEKIDCIKISALIALPGTVPGTRYHQTSILFIRLKIINYHVPW